MSPYLSILRAAMAAAPDEDARGAIAEIIAMAPTLTIEDVRVKFETLVWARGGDASLPLPADGTDERIIAGLIRDLVARQGG